MCLMLGILQWRSQDFPLGWMADCHRYLLVISHQNFGIRHYWTMRRYKITFFSLRFADVLNRGGSDYVSNLYLKLPAVIVTGNSTP